MKTSFRLFPARWLALGLTLIALATTSAGTFKRITIDGSFADWAGVPPAATDDEGDALEGFDLRDIYVANDDQYLYFMVRIYASSTNSDYGSFHHHFYINSDNDPGTGFGGTEMAVEDSGAFSQRSGADWSDGPVTGLDGAQAPPGTLPTFQYEYRVSRSVRDIQPADVPPGSGNPPRDLPVFTQDTIGIRWDVMTADWSSQEDAGPTFTYDMAPTPPAFSGTQTIVGLATTAWQVNDTGTDLASDWLAMDYEDTQAGWRGGLGLFGFNAPIGVYPPVNTDLPSGHSTYYLRTHFTWNHDQNGVGLLVSNFLSAGAVFHLNGAELKRVRMPDGTIGYSTPATGGPAQPGTAELIDLPSGALIVGDNILEVEVHPAAGAGSSLVFGMALIASDNFPPRLEDPTQPADRNVTEGQATTFSPGAVAGTVPFTYQWFNGVDPILNATSATFTLDPVRDTDAGSYSVEITNPKGLKVRSRAAVLTTTAVPVVLTDPNLPADLTVAEGTTATFTVAATGSLPTYTWFKDDVEITGAVGPVLTLNGVPLSDDGTKYSVFVANRLGGVPSRKATLTVVNDRTPPRITSASGGGRAVLLTFSEPLDPTSAQLATSYTLDGGVPVQSAVLDPVTGSAVTLTTVQQTFGQVYTLSVAGVEDVFGNAANATAFFRSSILVDGDFEDWASIPVALTQDQLNPGTVEFNEVAITNDTEYLYVRFSFWETAGPLWDWDAALNYWQVAFDLDNDPATGFFNGAEAVDEMNNPFRLSASWNDGSYVGGDAAIAPVNITGKNFEVRVSLRATHEVDHSLLFPTAASGGTIGVFCRVINTGWNQLDVTPSTPYTFNTTFSAMPPTITVTRVGNKIQLTWPGGGTLETRANLSTGNWTTVQGATSGYQIDPTSPTAGKAAFYRVRQ